VNSLVEGWVQWELIPCVEAVEWSQSGLLLDCCSLTDAACSGQEPEHMWPQKMSMVLLAFLTMSRLHRMDVEGWVVGLGGIVGKEGVVLMALPMVISQRGMNIKGRVVVVVVIVGSL